MHDPISQIKMLVYHMSGLVIHSSYCPSVTVHAEITLFAF